MSMVYSMSMSMLHVHASCPCWMSMFMPHIIGVCVCECVFVCMFVCINAGNAGLSGIRSVRYRNKKLTNDAGTVPVPDQAKAVQHFFCPVPDWNYWCRNADAGISFLDTLQKKPCRNFPDSDVDNGCSRPIYHGVENFLPLDRLVCYIRCLRRNLKNSDMAFFAVYRCPAMVFILDSGTVANSTVGK